MKIIKKNQVIIYSIALMLIVAGYLNYTTTNDLKSTIKTSSSEEEQLASENNIGDAELVNANVTDNSNENGNLVSNQNDNSDANTSDNTNINVSENTNLDVNVNGNSNNILKDVSSNTKSGETEETSSAFSGKNTDSDYFTASKLERDSMYSQMIETYENILNSNNISETQKQSAEQEITKINNIKNKIMICENLIKTKGFSNSIVFVNDDSISVIVQTDELKTDGVAQIQNIISRELNAKVENIHISKK